jgi:TonB family protein
MSIAQKYRIQSSAPGRRAMVGYLVAAVVLNLGVIVLSTEWWSTLTARFQESGPTPIEFIAVDAPESTPPPETERRSSVDSTAGGEHDPNRPLSATQPGSSDVSSAPSPAQPSGQPEPPSSESSSDPQTPTFDTLTAPSPNRSAPRPEPSPFTADSPRPDRTPSRSASDLASSPSAQSPPLTAGNDGLLNPNRTSSSASIGADVARDDVWGPYIDRLREKIRREWSIIGLDRNREARLEFSVGPQGQLQNLRVAQSSGSPEADEAALRAVQAAAPFDPFPSGAQEPSLNVNFTFTYTVWGNN